MCLYEQTITNQKYEPNIKNKGNAPKANDYRQLYIKIGCGWCEECRKKIANDWKIRIYEELKRNNNVEFVNLSYSPDSIKEIEEDIIKKKYKGIKGNEIDVNIVAAYSIRMFTERWRKKYKKAPRHWFVTELGHNNSERLHLHGLIWNESNTPREEFREDIKKKWKYGNVTLGDYVNEKTVNYISKYVTKLDEYHKGYKQKTFVSKGIGEYYIIRGKQIHIYRGEETIKTYKTFNGYTLSLPKYYRQKVWNDEEREKLWSLQMDKNVCYIGKQEYDTENENTEYVEKFLNELEGARKTNKRAGYGDNKTKNWKYIITDKMKMTYKELLDYDRIKTVKKVERRIIDKIKEPEETKKINKGANIETLYYGKYKGTTTETERNYNELIEDSKILGISVRKLRLIKHGIYTFNSQVSTNKQIECGELLINLLKKKYEN